ncbi:hypothetical protein [Victivallis sp. Marseille-Q1083]|uniref:hypothetical protein n=1 Tax=Victivallis sp. Marseille-Q1083 TaxID=2717288 RepID=UPI0015884679|nr:hypothetical protein [Victivallis sp. Marseille-Q1083]
MNNFADNLAPDRRIENGNLESAAKDFTIVYEKATIVPFFSKENAYIENWKK